MHIQIWSPLHDGGSPAKQKAAAVAAAAGQMSVAPSVLQKMVRGPLACNGTAMCVITAMKMPLLATGQDRHPPAGTGTEAGVQVEDGIPRKYNCGSAHAGQTGAYCVAGALAGQPVDFGHGH